MTPPKARQQAFQYEKDNPQASIHQAYMQGFIFAQQYYNIDPDEVISLPLCHSASPIPPPTDIVLGGSPSEPPTPTFEEFWNTYNYKKAKPQTLRFWNKLTTSQKAEIMHVLPSYIASTPDKHYRMHPATFINPTNQRWKDEITHHEQPTEQQQRFAAYADAIQGLNPRS